MNENTQKNTDSDSNVFVDSPISRRDFARLSAATAGALALPGTATADTGSDKIESPKMTDEYQFVVNNIIDRQTPTLILFSDSSGLNALDAAGIEAHTTTEPTIAAYAQLSTEQVQAALKIDSTVKFRFSPGSNPFWLLDYYPDGIFLDPTESVSWIDFEEMVTGMQRLEDSHSDRLDFYSIGQSPGYFNFLTQEEDPKPVWVAEVTNNIHDEESFREKEKVFFSLSIHGDERAGAEAGTRFIEDLLTGSEPTVEALLDDIVVIFLYTNPDGWVARKPYYNIETEGEGNMFQRGTAQVDDPNRQYPTVGWIDPIHYPAEPEGTNLKNDDPAIDTDVPPEYTERVPDSLAIVEHFRDYENLSYGSDLHGASTDENMIEGLVVNDEFSYETLHNIYEMNAQIDTRVTPKVDPLLDDAQDVFEDITQKIRENEDVSADEELPMPTNAFNYGTIYDTLQYSTTGILVSWMAQPKEMGGLGMPVMAHEMTYSNDFGSTVEFRPELNEIFVVGYTTVIRVMSEYAGTNHSTTVETNGRSTAIVTTDTLTRSSEALEFTNVEEEMVAAAKQGLPDSELEGKRTGETVQTPDPVDVLGYEQRPYEVTPFNFFTDYAATALDNADAFTRVSTQEVADGALTDSSGDSPAFNNVVIIHDAGRGDQAYIGGLDTYVEAGGNLVLTDTGVNLLGPMRNGLAASISAEAVTTQQSLFAVLDNRMPDNHLLDGTRPIELTFWKLSPLGYQIDPEEKEAPITVVESDAFRAAGGSVAGTVNEQEQVAAGSLGGKAEGDAGIQVIGSLLPPALQTHLHPFGLVDYTTSFFGQNVLTNALGYEQQPITGEVEETDDADDIYQGPGDDDDGDDVDADGDGAIDEDDEDKDDDDDNDGNNRDDDGDGAIDEDDDRK